MWGCAREGLGRRSATCRVGRCWGSAFWRFRYIAIYIGLVICCRARNRVSFWCSEDAVQGGSGKVDLFGSGWIVCVGGLANL